MSDSGAESKKKIRLDAALLERGLCQNRKEAQALIMAGAVMVNDEKVTKSGTTVKSNDIIRLIHRLLSTKHVSRGGLKLEKALEYFEINVAGRICLDIGASTGGFTDCLLQNGAVNVYAIDVGYGQLDWKLRSDERVLVFERTNARYLEKETLYAGHKTDIADLAVIDCSFISLDKILPAAKNLLGENYQIIALIKPQFEAGKEKVKKGVVRDKKTQIQVLEHIASTACNLDLSIISCTHSPVKGPKGNIEYLALIQPAKKEPPDFRQIVEDAFNELNQE